MKGLDTNLLVRFLTGDDPLQTEKVYRIFKKAESENTPLFVPLLVVLELIWVLESAFNISRADIIDAIEDLLSIPVLKFERSATLGEFIVSAKEGNVDLSDLLIACSARAQGCETTFTFDKKASKFSFFELA